MVQDFNWENKMPSGITGQVYFNSQYMTYYNLFDASLLTYARVGSKMVQLATNSAITGLGLMSGCSFNNICYIFSGFNGTTDSTQFSSFNPRINKWTVLTAAPLGGEQACMVGLNNYIYVFAFNLVGNANSSATVMTYDINLGTWSSSIAAALPVAVGQSSACALNGSVYLQTGVSQVSSAATIRLNMYCYDPISNIWTSLANYPNANGVRNSNLVALNDNIYVLGGVDGGTGNSVATCYRFNPFNKTYTQITSMPAASDSGGAVALNNKIYYFGGETNGTAKNSIFIYDPNFNSWSTDSVSLVNTGGQGGSPGCLAIFPSGFGA